MIGNGPDSIAANLHYPPKTKAAKIGAAIPFYCEVGPRGKSDHFQLYGSDDKAEFRLALLAALKKGRFEPAMSNGRAVSVIIGGTAFFMFHDNQPTIAVTLSTADREKTAALGNYIQPQMLGSSIDFRRKIWKARSDKSIHLQNGVHPGAVAVVDVDQDGNLVSTKIQAESPPDSGWGALLLKALQTAKFIPALENGQPVAGQFDIVVNYDDLRDPDEGPPVGSHLLRDDFGR
jgi:Gram-negative bacterial TonB protein C-terminal